MAIMMFDANLFIAEATRFFLTFIAGMLVAPLFYVIHIRRHK